MSNSFSIGSQKIDRILELYGKVCMISKRIDDLSLIASERPRMGTTLQRMIPVFLLAPLLVCSAGCQTAAPKPSAPVDPNAPTNILLSNPKSSAPM